MLEITFLYIDDCPSWIPALENLKQVIESERIPATLALLKINDPEHAQREKFLGSPSIRVNGVDLWPEDRENYALSCRIYQTPAGMRGSPTTEMLRDKLLKAIPK